LKLFQRRYENGYNLNHDKRYNAWVHVAHPEPINLLLPPGRCSTPISPGTTTSNRETRHYYIDSTILHPADPQASAGNQTSATMPDHSECQGARTRRTGTTASTSPSSQSGDAHRGKLELCCGIL